jgi:DNA invertase Pin-like site-specific DNA recombinase
MTPALIHQPPRAIGYARVSSGEQVESGLGLSAQRAAMEAECARRGWVLELACEEGASGKSLDGRPVLRNVLDRLDRHEADVLMVAKLDRLSRSVHDFTGITKRAEKRGWSVVLLDANVDTTTLTGALMANVMSSFSEYERGLIAQRTKDALAAKKAAGMRLGRPRQLSNETVERIVAARADGKSLADIARSLTEEAVPTAQGGKQWYRSTVRGVLRSAALDAESRELGGQNCH